LRTRIFARVLPPALLGAWVFCATGCVHPLGPGFHFDERQAEILVSTGAPGRIHLKVTDRLENTGNRKLDSLAVRLPDAPSFGAQNLRVLIEGKAINPPHISKTDTRMVSATFNPPWQQTEKREIVAEWDLAPEASTRGNVAASADGFFVADETALPLWQTPNGIFAKGGLIPDNELLSVFVPPDYRVLAPGKLLKATPEGSWVVHRFAIGPKEEFLPYVIAGRYQEKTIESHDGQVQYWTFQPIDGDAAQKAADRLVASMKALSAFFGTPSSGTTAVRIVESPVEMRTEFAASDDPGGASFPEGALLDSRAFVRGLTSEGVLQLAEYELARTWFGWRVRPKPEAQILMGRGVGLFGLVIIAEERGPEERSRMVASLIARYDRARAIAPDQRLMEPPVGYSRMERISTAYRAALFFVALEDVCGHDNLSAALQDIIHVRAGNETSYEELRSAAETASRKDLAEMFRRWLVEPGLPREFRAKYQAAQAQLRN
jgi:hypothetical protein